jgi:hypothetical protein
VITQVFFAVHGAEWHRAELHAALSRADRGSLR